ncbi:flagellar basal body P-ring formation chaperone FlgA [Sinimarinibacterium thermocellulolyticum]|uniref:Flagella basal body P-ring formation protein FlgA n=1 Tax=Sinimarinibacterium thermocellulolyticum TaxID=3170016 RepID=A0ABV2AA31_9GAMM
MRALPLTLTALALLATDAVRADRIEDPARIQSVAIAAVAAQMPASARVSGGVLDPRLRLPACTETPLADPPTLRGAQTSVTVRCTRPPWTVYVPVRISDLRLVVVLAQAVAPGERLDPARLRLEMRDVAALPFGYVASLEEAAGLQARRALPSGAVLTPGDARPPQLVKRGQTVTLIGRGAGIEVRAEGTALAAGARGERVRVRNSASKRIIEGVVSADGVVEIAL